MGRRAKGGGDMGLGRQMVHFYTRSPGAAAVAEMAERLGLGEVRLASVSPYLTYVVEAPLSPALDTLAAYATLALDTTASVIALTTLPPTRRMPVWAAGHVVHPSCHPDGEP